MTQQDNPMHHIYATAVHAHHAIVAMESVAPSALSAKMLEQAPAIYRRVQKEGRMLSDLFDYVDVLLGGKYGHCGDHVNITIRDGHTAGMPNGRYVDIKDFALEIYAVAGSIMSEAFLNEDIDEANRVIEALRLIKAFVEALDKHDHDLLVQVHIYLDEEEGYTFMFKINADMLYAACQADNITKAWYPDTKRNINPYIRLAECIK